MGEAALIRWGTAVLAAALLALSACSESNERTLPGRASPGAGPVASPTPEPGGPPKKEITKALGRFVRSVRAEDARTTVKLIDRDTTRYLKRLRRDVGRAGRARIARLSPWEKLALTMLRTDHDEETLGVLSVAGFLDYLIVYDKIIMPKRLDARRVRVSGSRAVVTTTPRFRLRFELVGGSWKMDARPLFRDIDDELRRLARARGLTVDEMVLWLGEQFTDNRVGRDVWEKPR